MGGIGLGLNTPSTEHLVHIRTQYTIHDTHIRNNTPQQHIYMHRTQFAHNMHTICTHTETENTEQTQYPDTEHTPEQNLNTTLRTQTQNTEQRTEQHTCTHSYSHI